MQQYPPKDHDFSAYGGWEDEPMAHGADTHLAAWCGSGWGIWCVLGGWQESAS